jgi:uncharacterized lipoprotein YajG
VRHLKILATLAATLFLVAACSTPRYIISTNDGTLIQSKGEPRLNSKTGMYEYRDLDGRDAAIKQSEVKQVVRR